MVNVNGGFVTCIKTTAMKRALIIDDLENARIGLRKDLEDYCHDVVVVGEADGVISGAKQIRACQPDVVFLDVHMKDGDGFDLLDIVGSVDFALIFTTSSNEHAIRAFRYSAIDYLLKPIDCDQLQQAVARATRTSAERLDLLRANLGNAPKRLALNSQERVDIVDLNDVVRLESSGSYTTFYLTDKRSLVVTRTLKEYDELLSDGEFIRVHQTHLVNVRFVRAFVKTDGGYLRLTDGKDIPVSSRKRAEVMRRLGV
jgi:two-component system LytT family response regulator